MRFSQDYLQNLANRFVLSELALPHIRLKRQGQEYSGLCPFHKEKSPSFTLNDQKGVFHCFGCGEGGDVIGFFMRINNLSFIEAVTELSHKAGVPLPEYAPPTREEIQERHEQENIYKLMEDVCQWYQDKLLQGDGKNGRFYLQNRKVLQSTITTYRLGFAPGRNTLKQEFMNRGYSETLLLKAGLLSQNSETTETYDRFRNRLIFPILDKKGRVIAFGGRVLDDSKPKYLNSPETSLFSKRYSLYGLSQALKMAKQDSPVIIVEGYMDVIALHQAGYFASVAPLGTALTEDQIKQLWRLSSEPILCFDGDTAGQRAAYRAANRALPLLKPGCSLQFVQLPKDEDPDSLVRRHAFDILESLFAKPQSLQDIIWQKEVMEHKTQTPEQQALVRQNVFAQLNMITDLSVRSLYQQGFKERFFQAFRRQKSTKKNNYSFAANPQETRMGLRTYFDPLTYQRYALLAAFVNHPQIFYTLEEQFTEIEFPDEELNNIRQEIFSLLSDTPDLDATTLKYHIDNRGYAQLLCRILSEETYTHASFVKLGTKLAEVIEGWQDIWRHMKSQRDLVQDVLQLKTELTKEFNPESWQRYQRLKAQTLSLH